jgi:hypothetical protein
LSFTKNDAAAHPAVLLGTTLGSRCFECQKENFMRIIFVVLIGSVLSIAAIKYLDRGIGGDELLASPTELSAMN